MPEISTQPILDGMRNRGSTKVSKECLGKGVVNIIPNVWHTVGGLLAVLVCFLSQPKIPSLPLIQWQAMGAKYALKPSTNLKMRD